MNDFENYRVFWIAFKPGQKPGYTPHYILIENAKENLETLIPLPIHLRSNPAVWKLDELCQEVEEQSKQLVEAGEPYPGSFLLERSYLISDWDYCNLPRYQSGDWDWDYDHPAAANGIIEIHISQSGVYYDLVDINPNHGLGFIGSVLQSYHDFMENGGFYGMPKAIQEKLQHKVEELRFPRGSGKPLIISLLNTVPLFTTDYIYLNFNEITVAYFPSSGLRTNQSFTVFDGEISNSIDCIVFQLKMKPINKETDLELVQLSCSVRQSEIKGENLVFKVEMASGGFRLFAEF